MCLINQRGEGFIAKKDLRVFKMLMRRSDDGYMTPFTLTNVVLGKRLKAKGEIWEEEIYNNTILSIGYIHAMTSVSHCPTYQYDVFVEAYIKKGTRYYIGTNNDVCAEAMFITDNIIKKDECKLAYSEWHDLYEPLYNLIPKDKVGIGWAMNYAGKFIHPSDIKGDDTIMGLVGSIDEDGNAVVVKMGHNYGSWSIANSTITKPWFIGSVEDYNNTLGKNLDILNMILGELEMWLIKYRC